MIMLFERSNDPLKLDLNSLEMKLFNAWCSRKGHTYFNKSIYELFVHNRH